MVTKRSICREGMNAHVLVVLGVRRTAPVGLFVTRQGDDAHVRIM